jgi:hypothetical protein
MLPHVFHDDVMSARWEKVLMKRTKLRRRLHHDGATLWDTRPAGSKPFFNTTPDWIEVPQEVLQRSGGSKKRRILRRFLHLCPLSGQMVKTYEIEGGLFCFESPRHGWLWTPVLKPMNPVVSHVEE